MAIIILFINFKPLNFYTMEAILNNMKRFDNLYSTNKNVSMLKTFDVSYKLFYYGRLVTVIFTPKGWHIVNL